MGKTKVTRHGYCEESLDEQTSFSVFTELKCKRGPVRNRLVEDHVLILRDEGTVHSV